MNISQRVFIGKKINNIYTMSMYIDRELINENIVIFLNFNYWRPSLFQNYIK